MSEPKELFNELKEESLGQVTGGADFKVGAHVECFRHIKWKVDGVGYVALGAFYDCTAVSWPEDWEGWLKAINYKTSIMGSQIIGTW